MAGSFRRLLRNLRTGAAQRIADLLQGEPPPARPPARRSADDILAELLNRSEVPRIHPDEAEQRVREMMAGEICDLRVAYQVAHARASGRAGMIYIEHICLSEDCPHEYMMRLPGPLTREVAERDAAIKANVDRRWFWRS